MRDCSLCRYDRIGFKTCGAGVGRPPANADGFSCSRFAFRWPKLRWRFWR